MLKVNSKKKKVQKQLFLDETDALIQVTFFFKFLKFKSRTLSVQADNRNC